MPTGRGSRGEVGTGESDRDTRVDSGRGQRRSSGTILLLLAAHATVIYPPQRRRAHDGDAAAAGTAHTLKPHRPHAARGPIRHCCAYQVTRARAAHAGPLLQPVSWRDDGGRCRRDKPPEAALATECSEGPGGRCELMAKGIANKDQEGDSARAGGTPIISTTGRWRNTHWEGNGAQCSTSHQTTSQTKRSVARSTTLRNEPPSAPGQPGQEHQRGPDVAAGARERAHCTDSPKARNRVRHGHLQKQRSWRNGRRWRPNSVRDPMVRRRGFRAWVRGGRHGAKGKRANCLDGVVYKEMVLLACIPPDPAPWRAGLSVRADGQRCCSPLQCLSVRMLTIAPLPGTESTTNTQMQSNRPLALSVKTTSFGTSRQRLVDDVATRSWHGGHLANQQTPE